MWKKEGKGKVGKGRQFRNAYVIYEHLQIFIAISNENILYACSIITNIWVIRQLSYWSNYNQIVFTQIRV